MKIYTRCLSLLLLGTAFAAAARAQWTVPTKEELTMTSIPEVPGADAVILNRDEVDDDDLHMRNIYYRIKVLGEGGLHYGDVELNFDKRHDTSGYTIGEIYARTVQPDGTILPFTGKPYDKVINKDKENAYTTRVFSLPSVKVGSIIEYRYTVRWDDHSYRSPYWMVQTDLFLRKGHFLWRPTDRELMGIRRGGRESYAERVVWARSLPPGVEVKNTRLPTGRIRLELNVADIAPFGNEEYMPPIQSAKYHVFFYYTPYVSAQDFWDTETQYWSSDAGKFMNAGETVRSVVREVAQGVASDEDKARQLYSFVMRLENTDFTRERTSTEERDAIKNAEDVLRRKHGSSNQIAKTYVALARAAGLQAVVMAVADRGNLILDANWQDFENQLTDEIAVVQYGGAQHFLDPGSRYTPFGHLDWSHTYTAGVMQDNKDKTKMFSQTPGEPYAYSHTSRVADLKIEPDGHMAGTVTLTFKGSPAVNWRQTALRSDSNAMKDKLKQKIEAWMPGGTTVEIRSLANADNPELPLSVIAGVDGHIGNAVGSRVMLPVSLFEENSRPVFPHERREQGVYFSYSEMIQDAVRYVLPAGWAIESAPTKDVVKFQQAAAYAQIGIPAANGITLRRDLILGELYYPQKDYPELRSFYTDIERKDHAKVVLKRAGQTAAAQPEAAGKVAPASN